MPPNQALKLTAKAWVRYALRAVVLDYIINNSVPRWLRKYNSVDSMNSFRFVKIVTWSCRSLAPIR